MKKLNGNVEFAYVQGDHFTIHTADYKLAGYTFLEKKYAAWPAHKSSSTIGRP
jgi:hypothetical protein